MMRYLCVGVVCISLCCWGCNNHTVQPFTQNISASQDETVQAQGPNKVDILWVVDNSASMCEEQASLRDNINQVVQELDRVGADFQLAVVTTDMTTPGQLGRFQNQPDGDPGFSCTIAVDVSACPDDLPLIIRSSDARYQDAEGNLDTGKVQRDFGCNATVGTNGDPFERGLEAAQQALSPALLSGFNQGFLRDDALLAIVFVTDENDCSDRGAIDTNLGGNVCEWQSDRLVPVQDYIDAFQALKPNPSQLILAAILAPDDGRRYEHPDDVEPSCLTTDAEGNTIGQGYAGYRYTQVLDAFDASYTSSICNPPFTRALEAIADLVVDRLSTQCLSKPPARCTEQECLLQVEVQRPVSSGLPTGFTETTERNPTPGTCLLSQDAQTYRCVLVEGDDYDINPQSQRCIDEGAAGTEIVLREELDTGEQLGVRYPTALGQ